jgi:hypothetical protein
MVPLLVVSPTAEIIGHGDQEKSHPVGGVEIPAMLVLGGNHRDRIPHRQRRGRRLGRGGPTEQTKARNHPPMQMLFKTTKSPVRAHRVNDLGPGCPCKIDFSIFCLHG